MNHSSRRAFLQSLAAASLGSAAPGFPGRLHAEALPMLFAEAQSRTLQTPFPADAIDAAIFPKPQQIASSGSDFLLDDQVRIVVPMNPSAEDLSLARFLRDV
ncbi:MAG TPA: hypothetical protein VK604_08145 [Bryobacteraceae bacterium]|nr:hypothetical protein [Bryobacteraceae bacterium]